MPANFAAAANVRFPPEPVIHSLMSCCFAMRAFESKPWIVALAFGLLHGFGFAGALKEIGFPQSDVPLSLLIFNLGVEAGQLIFVAVALIVFLLGGLLSKMLSAVTPVHARLFGAYMIGTASIFWLISGSPDWRANIAIGSAALSLRCSEFISDGALRRVSNLQCPREMTSLSKHPSPLTCSSRYRERLRYRGAQTCPARWLAM